MELDGYAGKRFALVLTDEQDETTAFGGWMAFLVGDALVLRREDGTLNVEDEWIARIRAVDTDRLREILPEADFFLPLNVGPMAEGEAPKLS
ncbi:MAG: hypothetical protein PW792_00915 [Acidobacteriaceae bacterium]|nr:hypothetical protein [Acidobacteriaceae bacterium]